MTEGDWVGNTTGLTYHPCRVRGIISFCRARGIISFCRVRGIISFCHIRALTRISRKTMYPFFSGFSGHSLRMTGRKFRFVIFVLDTRIQKIDILIHRSGIVIIIYRLKLVIFFSHCAFLSNFINEKNRYILIATGS